jgi:hypothetical protein
MNERVHQLLNGNEALAVDFGIGVFAVSFAASVLWLGLGGSKKYIWSTVLCVFPAIALLAPDLPFVAGKVLKAVFFAIALPAGGWFSFLALVAAIGWLFGRYGYGRRAVQELPQHAPMRTVEHAPEPARLTRQGTTLAVPVPEQYRRETVKR